MSATASDWRLCATRMGNVIGVIENPHFKLP